MSELMTVRGYVGCYPYQSDDPFVLSSCPHVFFVGSQPRFETRLIHGLAGQTVRIIAVPKFKETGEVVLVDLDDEERSVRVVEFRMVEDQ